MKNTLYAHTKCFFLYWQPTSFSYLFSLPHCPLSTVISPLLNVLVTTSIFSSTRSCVAVGWLCWAFLNVWVSVPQAAWLKKSGCHQALQEPDKDPLSLIGCVGAALNHCVLGSSVHRPSCICHDRVFKHLLFSTGSSTWWCYMAEVMSSRCMKYRKKLQNICSELLWIQDTGLIIFFLCSLSEFPPQDFVSSYLKRRLEGHLEGQITTSPCSQKKQSSVTRSKTEGWRGVMGLSLASASFPFCLYAL